MVPTHFIKLVRWNEKSFNCISNFPSHLISDKIELGVGISIDFVKTHLWPFYLNKNKQRDRRFTFTYSKPINRLHQAELVIANVR